MELNKCTYFVKHFSCLLKNFTVENLSDVQTDEIDKPYDN